MKKLIFIAFVLVILIAYCFGSASNFGYTDVPRYVEKKIDILGGMSMEEWESNKAARDNRLKELVRAGYQPPIDGYNFAKQLSYDKTHTLTADDYVNIVKLEPIVATKLSVRDPSAVLDLASMNYTIRDDIIGSKGNVIAKSGDVLDKNALDALIGVNIKRIRIVGTGGVVSIELGTMIMVPLIFLALLAALKIIMFDPLIKIMDERAEEIAVGSEQAKINRIDIAKLETESKEKFDHVRREHIFALGKAKHEIILESEVVVHEASDEARAIREEAHKELQEKLAEVDKELRSKVDELAQDIVAQVLKGERA